MEVREVIKSSYGTPSTRPHNVLLDTIISTKHGHKMAKHRRHSSRLTPTVMAFHSIHTRYHIVHTARNARPVSAGGGTSNINVKVSCW